MIHLSKGSRVAIIQGEAKLAEAIVIKRSVGHRSCGGEADRRERSRGEASGTGNNRLSRVPCSLGMTMWPKQRHAPRWEERDGQWEYTDGRRTMALIWPSADDRRWFAISAKNPGIIHHEGFFYDLVAAKQRMEARVQEGKSDWCRFLEELSYD